MKRRTLLQVGLFSLGVVLPKWLYHQSSPTLDSALDQKIERHVLSLFHNPSGAKAIGTEYLQHLPESVDKHTLIAHLCSSCSGGGEALNAMDDEALRLWLNQRQRQDFENGNVVKLRGWILSKTEVELCALVALA